MTNTRSILSAVRQINACHDAFIDYNVNTKEIDVYEVVSVNAALHKPASGYVTVIKYQYRRFGKMSCKDLADILSNY